MKRICLSFALLLVSACESTTVRDTMGLTHRAPDEFRVVSRPPLSVPPDFNLRPPANPGEAGGSEPSYKQAESVITGTSNAAATPSVLQPGTAETAVQPVAAQALGADAQAIPAVTPSDSQFLQNAGATAADTSIRDKLRQEADSSADKDLIDRLRDKSDIEPTVDAAGEQQRLQADKAAGKPATAGDTPMAEPKDNGPLGHLLGY